MALCSGASAPLNGPVQRRVELAFAAPAASSGLRRYGSFYRSPSSVPSREVHDLDPSQVHPRSVRGQRKLARTAQPEAGLSVVGRCILQPIHTRHELPVARRGQSKAVPDISIVLATARGSHGPCVGQTLDPPVIFPEPDGLLTEDSGPSKSRRKRFGEPPASASPPRAIRPNAPPGRVHDRGRCPLYVRAQLETAGLPWTQRDVTGPEATARKTGYPQLTGRFRR